MTDAIMNKIELQRHPKTNELIPEIWKDIEGYEGLYQVSNYGRVKSLKRKVKNGRGYRTVNEKILKCRSKTQRYLHVSLYKQSKDKVVYPHRLVAKYFVSNPKNKPCVNHIDSNPYNNYYKNLEWVTHKENTKHGISKGNINMIGKENHMSRKVYQYDLDGNFIRVFDTIASAAKHVNGTSTNIINVCKNKYKTSMGYKWSYGK